MGEGDSTAHTGALKWRTAVLVCLACIVEGADMAVLPAVYLAISRSLHATPAQLGVMTLCRALMQACSSPVSGVLGDVFDRTLVVATGACLWSACTIGVSASSTLLHACLFTTANGLGLALVIPCAQSLMADYFPADQRGRAFGAMQLTMSAGSMVGSLFATNMAAHEPWGVDGWRVAMRAVSALSFLVGVLVALLASDPRLALTEPARARDRGGPSHGLSPHASGEVMPFAALGEGSQGARPSAIAAFIGGTAPREEGPHGALSFYKGGASTRGDAAAGSSFERVSATESYRGAPLLGPPSGSPSSSSRSKSPVPGGGGGAASRWAPAAAALAKSAAGIADIMRLRTFQIIVAQGIVGTMPWNAIAFLTLWLQLLGFSDLRASVLAAAFYGASSAGAFLGGWIGDVAARWAPNSGRIYTAQVSVASGVPLTCLLILGLPSRDLGAAFPLYLLVIGVFGLTISWCGAGCNSPIFAEIVPPEKRSIIYAFDRCFEGALAACAAPVVGIVAEVGFGYNAAEPRAVGNAGALGSSLLYCLCVPWALCFVCYYGLHKTYPADRARVKQAQALRLHTSGL